MGWPGEKALIKLGDLISEGTGGAFTPWQTRRKGKAQADAMRDEMLMLAQTENDVKDIKTGKKKYTEDRHLITIVPEDQAGESQLLVELNDGRIEPYLSLEAIDKQSQTRKQVQALQEEINLTKTILLAEKELETEDYEANDEPVDPDWFTRWRDSAEKVSNDDLQRLWAKALAGEVANPGAYSLRTLEFLKDLSQAEAKQISKLAPYVINNVIYKLPYLDNKGLDFEYLLEMEDLGLITGHQGGGLELTSKSLDQEVFNINIQYGRQILLINKEQLLPALRMTALKVTKLGLEVLKLGVFPFDYQYLEEIGTLIKSQQFSVKIADITGFSSGGIHFGNSREL